MRFLLDTPWYFVFLCLLLGVAYSYLLYFFHQRKGYQDLSPKANWILASLRFVAVFLIAFLLLGPLARREINQTEKPIVLIAQDNSSSIVMCKDSAYYKTEYAERMEALVKQLKRDYEVEYYSFGGELEANKKADFTEGITDIASPLNDLYQRYENRNVGAIILASDGIYNQGMNPTSVNKFSCPIYTIAMGDTSRRKDASLTDIRCNSIAYLGNEFAMDVAVKASLLKGSKKNLSVSSNGKILFSKNIEYTDDNFFHTEHITLKADQVGLQQYTVKIAPAEEEISVKNNIRKISVEVIDGRQKVLILAYAPHPDIAAIRQSIEGNENFQVDCFMANEFKGDIAQYNVVILHQLPAKGDHSRVIQNIGKANVPLLIIVGRQTDLAKFNSLQTGVEIHTKIDRQNECTAECNRNFSLFLLDEKIQHQLEQFPPLVSPFGDYKVAGNTQIFLQAKIGTLSSKLPLMAFSQRQDVRIGLVLGEGLWKWRLADFQMNHNHDAFNELMGKTISYTALRLGTNRFHVSAEKLYRANEPIEIQAELYNESYEPINAPEVKFSLTRKGAKAVSYTFNKVGNRYQLNLGVLPPGEYQFMATTILNGTKFSDKGAFIIQEINLEEISLVADHVLLHTIAHNSGATMVFPNEIEKIPDMLSQRDDIKSFVYSHTRYTDLLNLPWIFILLVLLLGVEWAIRKYNGTL